MKHFLLVLFISFPASCQPSTTKTESTETPPAPLPTDFMEELWYKNGLVYSVDVEVFKESDNDGVGDFKGLTQQLDYLKAIGVETIWRAPFQPSPNKDDGYDGMVRPGIA